MFNLKPNGLQTTMLLTFEFFGCGRNHGKKFPKATSHSTIFDIPMRPLREDQKQRHRFTRQRRTATPVMVIIPLNFARCTLPKQRDR